VPQDTPAANRHMASQLLEVRPLVADHRRAVPEARQTERRNPADHRRPHRVGLDIVVTCFPPPKTSLARNTVCIAVASTVSRMQNRCCIFSRYKYAVAHAKRAALIRAPGPKAPAAYRVCFAPHDISRSFRARRTGSTGRSSRPWPNPLQSNGIAATRKYRSSGPA